MDTKKEITALKKRVDALEKKFSQSNFLLFSYIQAMLGLMGEHDMIDPKEFQQYLIKHKKSLAKKIRDAEFFKNVEKQFKDNDESKD